MSILKTSTLMATVSILAISGIALAAPKADMADTKFTQADTDFDGNLSKDEMRALREKKKADRSANRFERQDLNGDGVLEKEEIESARNTFKAKRKAKRLERFDTNGDGELVIETTENAAHAVLSEIQMVMALFLARNIMPLPRLSLFAWMPMVMVF